MFFPLIRSIVPAWQAGLLLLTSGERAAVRQLAGCFDDLTSRCERANAQGGAALQAEILALTRDARTRSGQLSSGLAVEFLDGLQLFHLRREHRDEVQWRQLARGLFGAPLRGLGQTLVDRKDHLNQWTEPWSLGLLRLWSLRNLRSDVASGRILFPLDRWEAWGVDAHGLAAGEWSEAAANLAREVAAAAREDLDRGAAFLGSATTSGRRWLHGIGAHAAVELDAIIDDPERIIRSPASRGWYSSLKRMMRPGNLQVPPGPTAS